MPYLGIGGTAATDAARLPARLADRAQLRDLFADF